MSMISKRAHSWWKLNAVQSALLHAPSDWIMWLDSDAYLIKPPNEILNNIKFNIIPFKNAICVDPVAYLTREYPISILPHPTSNFNLGVMLFNSTNVHSTTIFIKDMWNIKCSKSWMTKRNWEQDCLNDVFRHKHLRIKYKFEMRICALNFTFINTPHGRFIEHYWKHHRHKQKVNKYYKIYNLNDKAKSLLPKLYQNVHKFKLHLPP